MRSCNLANIQIFCPQNSLKKKHIDDTNNRLFSKIGENLILFCYSRTGLSHLDLHLANTVCKIIRPVLSLSQRKG